jgi:hypothetical protein
MCRFAVLLHETPPDSGQTTHWDFMLQVGNVLRTWSLNEEPRMGATIAATALPDHRLAYLDYEGPVSRNRGTVTRWDTGRYLLEHETAAHLYVRLHGTRLQCGAKLTRDENAPRAWSLEITR